MGKGKRRQSRISFCEWNSESWGAFNTGGVICENCNFSKSLDRGERKRGTYNMNNHLTGDADKCADCGSNEHMYWLPPIARVPRKSASKRKWKKFWKDLKARRFNHPSGGCR